MSTPIQEGTQEILSALREAVIFERQERMDAPIEARQAAEQRIATANERTLALIKAAWDNGASKTLIAQHLGIQNLGQVSKLINRAEAVGQQQ